MLAILHSLGMFVADLFKPRCRLEAENLFLRHQLSIALRRAAPRPRPPRAYRGLLGLMTPPWPSPIRAAQGGPPCRWAKRGVDSNQDPAPPPGADDAPGA